LVWCRGAEVHTEQVSHSKGSVQWEKSSLWIFSIGKGGMWSTHEAPASRTGTWPQILCHATHIEGLGDNLWVPLLSAPETQLPGVGSHSHCPGSKCPLLRTMMCDHQGAQSWPLAYMDTHPGPILVSHKFQSLPPWEGSPGDQWARPRDDCGHLGSRVPEAQDFRGPGMVLEWSLLHFHSAVPLWLGHQLPGEPHCPSDM
jgi:hypothetical protein